MLKQCKLSMPPSRGQKGYNHSLFMFPVPLLLSPLLSMPPFLLFLPSELNKIEGVSCGITIELPYFSIFPSILQDFFLLKNDTIHLFPFSGSVDLHAKSIGSMIVIIIIMVCSNAPFSCVTFSFANHISSFFLNNG